MLSANSDVTLHVERAPQPGRQTSLFAPDCPGFRTQVLYPEESFLPRGTGTWVTLSTWVKCHALLHVLNHFPHGMYLTWCLEKRDRSCAAESPHSCLPESSVPGSLVTLPKRFRAAPRGRPVTSQDWLAEGHYRIPCVHARSPTWALSVMNSMKFGLCLLTLWRTQLLFIGSHLNLSNLRKI